MSGLRTAGAVRACCEPAIIFRPRLWGLNHGLGPPPHVAIAAEYCGGHVRTPNAGVYCMGTTGGTGHHEDTTRAAQECTQILCSHQHQGADGYKASMRGSKATTTSVELAGWAPISRRDWPHLPIGASETEPGIGRRGTRLCRVSIGSNGKGGMRLGELDDFASLLFRH